MKRIVLLLLFAFMLLKSEELNIDKLLIQAKNENKQLMFFYIMPGCPYCKKMINENFKDIYVSSKIKSHFILINIDATSNDSVKFRDFEGSQEEFSKYMKAFVVPSTQFLDQNGNEIKIIEDDETVAKKELFQPIIGPRDTRDYKKYLDYIISNEYKRVEFSEYSADWDYHHDN